MLIAVPDVINEFLAWNYIGVAFGQVGNNLDKLRLKSLLLTAVDLHGQGAGLHLTTANSKASIGLYAVHTDTLAMEDSIFYTSTTIKRIVQYGDYTSVANKTRCRSGLACGLDCCLYPARGIQRRFNSGPHHGAF